MLVNSLLLLLLSNAVTLRHDKSILYSRITIAIFICSALVGYVNLELSFLNKGIGLFGGLFHTTCTTNIFHIFILLISTIILVLTSFYPRKVWSEQYSSIDKLLFSTFIYYQEKIMNIMGEQYKLIEYSLMLVFIITGALFLISTSDLVSVFLSIELQSYGLYLLSTIYRNSESATSGGLMYFLLGGLSSCFILLSTSLLYANSGTTNLDSLYIITSISDINTDSLVLWYKPYYIHISLLIMSVGFLFKVSAAPFHFWSPDVYDAIPTIVTTFVAIIAKISIFIFLLELVHYTSKFTFDMNFTWTISLLLSSLISLIIGTVVGLTQFRIKRLYAFSTISHVGFILLGLSIHDIASTQSFMFYMMQYSLSNLNAFIIIITIGYSFYFYIYKGSDIENKNIDKMGNRDKIENIDKLHNNETNDSIIEDTSKNMTFENNSIKTNESSEIITNENNDLKDINNSPIQLISQLKGYYFINPFLASSLSITLFSFVGIPPLIGFFAKQMILSAALDNGYIFMSFIAILTSVISAVYYLVIIKQIFFDKPNYTINSLLNDFKLSSLIIEKNIILKKINLQVNNITVSSSLSLVVSILTLMILFFIFIPEEWLSMTNILSLILFAI